ncbi:MAG: AAA domain-containing protein [Bacteroidota bacterium]
MRTKAFHDYLFKQYARIRDEAGLATEERLGGLRSLLLRLCELATENDRLLFSTFHARLAYIAHKYSFPPELTYQLRRIYYRRSYGKSPEDRLRPAFQALCKATLICFQQPIPETWEKLAQEDFPEPYRPPTVIEREPDRRVLWIGTDQSNKVLHLRDEAQPELTYRLSFQQEDQDEPVLQTIQMMQKIAGPPFLLNLITVRHIGQGLLRVDAIILLPDYLIDVTAVASAFGTHPPMIWSALSRKLLPFEQRPALLTGNIVNHFLDVLMSEPDTPFAELKQLIFQTQPLALCCLSDQEVKEMVQGLQAHYTTLRRVCKQDLASVGINRDQCRLEPAFYSPNYGLQGRLDLLYLGEDEQGPKTSIVELKSGSIYRPNRHGLSASHFVQTLLYDLMINRAYGPGANVAAYILYSKTNERPLRFAPAEPFRQREALDIRNKLLSLELLLCDLRVGPNLLKVVDRLFARLRPDSHQHISSFTRADFNRITTVYTKLSPIERRYLGAMMGFTAREQRLAKLGESTSERANGLASLWVDEPQDKIERFDALTGLVFDEYEPETGNLHFRQSADSDRMAKFRVGDIIALYQTDLPGGKRAEVLKAQVYKCTLIHLSPDRVTVSLRSRQLNENGFKEANYWTIERDVLDSSFGNFYRGLWSWAESQDATRQQWLGLSPPKEKDPDALSRRPGLTKEQQSILEKILAAPDYFLLWGPPGTGKTSVMLHEVVSHLLQHTKEHLLLLAYTNRAVDEICESIERINGGFDGYIRIGSRFGTAEGYQDRLLQVQAEGIEKRAELRSLIDRHRIVVGTVASVGGKEELFKLKKFDRIIVDEASQILEPLLIGLLSRIPKALLIGDHRQLPAVVQQKEQETLVYEGPLQEIGLFNLAGSLFERLYWLARKNNWTWAYDQLSHQGRMHQDIMAFPAKQFYEDQLFILPKETGQRHTEQQEILPFSGKDFDEQVITQIAEQRLLFIDSNIDQSATDNKVNRHEAEQIITLIDAFERLYNGHNKPIQAGDIGIIAPYRAQIAHLRQRLRKAGKNPDLYTVDTVERYQGGARRIILISLCVNDEFQVDTLARTDREGIDRKLNVAMTRAKEHLVIVGCKDLLSRSPHYKKLIEFVSLLVR